jgi:hypothetical protein
MMAITNELGREAGSAEFVLFEPCGLRPEQAADFLRGEVCATHLLFPIRADHQ